MKPIYKKIKEGIYQKTNTAESITVLDKEAILNAKKMIEEEIAVRQRKLDSINQDLSEIAKAK